jgi:alanine dehydrogenase
VNVYRGAVTNEGVAAAHGMEFAALDELIAGAG